MTGIDKLNLVCTIISIGLSIWASYSAKKAKQYREEALSLKDAFDLEGLLCTTKSTAPAFMCRNPISTMISHII